MTWLTFLLVAVLGAIVVGLLLKLTSLDLCEIFSLMFVVALVLGFILGAADLLTSRGAIAQGTVAGKTYRPASDDILWLPNGDGGLTPTFQHTPEAYVAVVATPRGTLSVSVSPAKWGKLHEDDEVNVIHTIGGLTGARYWSRIPDDP